MTIVGAGVELTQDDFKPLLRAAYIPFRYQTAKFADYGDSGERIRLYLGQTGQYINDCDDHRGVCMFGSAEQRGPLFPMLARSLVLRRDEVHYIQLSELADYLDSPEDAGNRIEKAYNVPALFIDDFYDASHPCRLNAREIRRVEALVKDRIGNNRRVYVSVDESDAGLDWYSNSLRALLAEHTRPLSV